MRTFDDRELSRRVNEVLYYIWDPIGVSEEPFARAEYESYVPKVLELVEKGNSIKEISEYLSTIVHSNMGSLADRRKCDHAAEILLKHKEAIKQGLA